LNSPRSSIIPPAATLEQPVGAGALESGVPAATAARKPALPALTGLRTLLAINIMFFHFTPPHPNFLSPLLNNAYVFVGFFFLISGFVLAYNYADRPVLSKRRFYVARISRVYPVYALVLLLSIPFLMIEWQAQSRGNFFTGLILTPLALQSWSPHLATFWNTVAWTVPAEFFLYLLFPFLLILISRKSHLFETPGRLIGLILAVWLVGLIPHTAYVLLNPDHLPQQADRYTYAYWLRALKYTPPFYICTFTAGVLVARLHAMLALTQRARILLSVSALLALGLFFAFAVERIPYVLVHGCLLLPVFAALLLGLAGNSPVASVFSWYPILKTGETTFSLYLVHFNTFLLIHYYRLPERLHVERFDPWISYVAILALAFAILRFYEGPARRFVLRTLNGERAGVA
jgi:peptidoglycan/LPS O-acetylase OafA/YrhL